MNFPDAAGISPWLGYSVGLRTPSRGVGANLRPCWGRSFQDFDRGARPNQATDLHQGIPAKNRLFMPSTAFCEQRKRLWPRSNPGLGIDGRRHASHAGLDQFQFDAPDSDSFPSVFRPRFGPRHGDIGSETPHGPIPRHARGEGGLGSEEDRISVGKPGRRPLCLWFLLKPRIMGRIMADQANLLLEVAGQPFPDGRRLRQNDSILLPEHRFLSSFRRRLAWLKLDRIRADMKSDQILRIPEDRPEVVPASVPLGVRGIGDSRR